MVVLKKVDLGREYRILAREDKVDHYISLGWSLESTDKKESSASEPVETDENVSFPQKRPSKRKRY